MCQRTTRGFTIVRKEINMNSLKGAMDRQAMDLIVEKIETEEMLLELLDLKIDFGQGYLFGEPKPIKK